MKRTLQLTLLLALAVAACMVPTDERADVEADVEPLTTCWNVLRTTTTPGWPPLDMIVTAAAMQSWQGGSWKPCTDNIADTHVICKRLIGTQEAVANWGYCLPTGGPACTMFAFYVPDSSETNPIHGLQVWTTDWDDDVYTHGTISSVNESPNFTGTIDVTHSSGNNWNVHTCITQ